MSHKLWLNFKFAVRGMKYLYSVKRAKSRILIGPFLGSPLQKIWNETHCTLWESHCCTKIFLLQWKSLHWKVLQHYISMSSSSSATDSIGGGVSVFGASPAGAWLELLMGLSLGPRGAVTPGTNGSWAGGVWKQYSRIWSGINRPKPVDPGPSGSVLILKSNWTRTKKKFPLDDPWIPWFDKDQHLGGMSAETGLGRTTQGSEWALVLGTK